MHPYAAHGEAYNLKGLIHGDISAGNVLIYPTLKRHPRTGEMKATRVALLADWELAQRVDQVDKGFIQTHRVVCRIQAMN